MVMKFTSPRMARWVKRVGKLITLTRDREAGLIRLRTYMLCRQGPIEENAISIHTNSTGKKQESGQLRSCPFFSVRAHRIVNLTFHRIVRACRQQEA